MSLFIFTFSALAGLRGIYLILSQDKELSKETVWLLVIAAIIVGYSVTEILHLTVIGVGDG